MPAKLQYAQLALPVAEWLQHVPDAVVQLMPKEAGQLTRAFAASAMAGPEQALGALKPLRACLKALQPTLEHLTPCHAAYLQACVANADLVACEPLSVPHARTLCTMVFFMTVDVLLR